ncbi:PGF-pre-PGF domain-containing protein [Halosolutus amylolyticus]|uniref:PGF-pre-PGF domain-containing protein n=1 Tax=Halosolutus amylolyticus TaxID=2932267 RepID=A0ABD5PQ03_9EURY|nr:PGF-pre-PGF domain-containing protein [Halosolutus amylolyticus]
MAIPTAAVTVFDTNSQDRITDDIVAEPSDGPNGAYAFVDNDTDELVVDLTASNDEVEGDGVSPDALTGVSDVFTLTYEGDEYAEVWLEDDTDDVTFYDGAGNSIEGQANNVTLHQNQTVHVGFSVDTRDLETIDPIIDSIEINARVPDDDGDGGGGGGGGGAPSPGQPAPPDPAPPDPTVIVQTPADDVRNVQVLNAQGGTAVTVDLEELRIGPHVTLDRTDVTMVDDRNAIYSIDASQKGPKFEPLDTLPAQAGAEPIGSYKIEDPPAADAVKSVEYGFSVDRNYLENEEIEPDEVTLYRYDDDKGTWTTLETKVLETSDDRVAYTATIDRFSLYAVGVDTAAITVTDATVEPDTVSIDENVTVTGMIANDGQDEGEYDAVLTVDGEVVDRQTVTVPAGKSVEVSFERSFDEAGEYDLGIGTVPAGTVTVEAAEEPKEPIEEPGGFGVTETGLVLVLLALALTALWFVRRRLDDESPFDRR